MQSKKQVVLAKKSVTSASAKSALQEGRSAVLPVKQIDALESNLRDMWQHVWKKDILNECQRETHPTLASQMLEVAGALFARFLQDRRVHKLKILELMAGNCLASKIIQKKISGMYSSWKMTDIGDYSSDAEQIDAIGAIEKYGKAYDTLLMICPPPGELNYLNTHSSYGDYFACKKFIEMSESGQVRYIVIIGELGNSDASKGMYLWMLKHPQLIMEFRCTFFIGIDHQGGPVEKEVFIFSVDK